MPRIASPRWPLIVWALQIVPCLALLTLGSTRLWLAVGDPVKTAVASGLGITWAAVVAAVLVWPTGRSWLRARRRQLLLAGGSLVLSLAVLDVALTLTGIVPSVAAQRDRSLSYALNPSASLRLVPKVVRRDDGEQIQINRRGFRGGEIEAEPVPGRTRIVVLGGSQVFDFYGNWPGRLAEQLRNAGHDVEVINAGVPGHDSTDSVAKLATDLWTLSPDIVVLCNAWNDAKWMSRLARTAPYVGAAPVAPEPWYPDWRLYPYGFDAFLSGSAFYRQYRGGWIAVSPEESRRAALTLNRGSAGPSPTGLGQYRLNLELTAKAAQEIGATLVLAKQARLETHDGSGDRQLEARRYAERNTGLSREALLAIFEASYKIVMDVAAEHSLAVVDMDRAMTGRGEFFIDGIHFSAEGARRAAALVAAVLEPILR